MGLRIEEDINRFTAYRRVLFCCWELSCDWEEEERRKFGFSGCIFILVFDCDVKVFGYKLQFQILIFI